MVQGAKGLALGGGTKVEGSSEQVNVLIMSAWTLWVGNCGRLSFFTNGSISSFGVYVKFNLMLTAASTSEGWGEGLVVR